MFTQKEFMILNAALLEYQSIMVRKMVEETETGNDYQYSLYQKIYLESTLLTEKISKSITEDKG